MSRPVLFFLIVAVTFTISFYFKDLIFSEPQVEVELPKEQVVRVALLNQSVSRGQLVSTSHITYLQMPVSQARAKGYPIETQLTMTEASRYRRDLEKNETLTDQFIAQPNDSEYALLALKKGHIPYFYQTSVNSFIDTLPLRAGDKVSFLSTTSSQSNILETGYTDITDITAQIILNDVDVLQIVHPDEESFLERGEIPQISVVVALTIEETLLLEMAQKVGDITIVPAKLARSYQSVRSSDVIEGQHGVRELRAEVQQR